MVQPTLDGKGTNSVDESDIWFTQDRTKIYAIGYGIKYVAGIFRSYIADIYDLPVCRHCADQYHPRSIQKNDLAYGTTTLALFSDLILGLFLATSLMSLQLWTLIELAGPIILLLLAQVITIGAFVIFVVFRAMGKSYDVAVMSPGYASLALGATPTAITNMTAVTE